MAGVIATSDALAAAWMLQPSAALSAGADDNYRLSERDLGNTYSLGASVGLLAHRSSDALVLRAGGLLGYQHHSGPAELEDEDFQALQLASVYSRERTVFSFGAEYRRDTTLVEVAAPLGEIDPGSNLDAGLVEESVRRNRLIADASFQHALSERFDGIVGYRLTGLDYDEDDFLVSSWSHEADARALYRLSERSRLGLGGGVLFFRSDDAVDQDVVSVTGTFDHRLSERSDIAAVIGAWRGEASTGSSATETGFTARVTGRTRGERWTTAVSLERDLRPTGAGALSEADQVLVRAAADLAPRLRFDLSGRAYQTRPLEAEEQQRTYGELALGLVWRVTRDWSLGTRYRHRRVDPSADDGVVSSDAVAVSLDYRPELEVPLVP